MLTKNCDLSKNIFFLNLTDYYNDIVVGRFKYYLDKLPANHLRISRDWTLRVELISFLGQVPAPNSGTQYKSVINDLFATVIILAE